MLNMHRILPMYKHSSKWLLLMDLEGTLWVHRRLGLGASLRTWMATQGSSACWRCSGVSRWMDGTMCGCSAGCRLRVC
jgi:hypothetical protein